MTFGLLLIALGLGAFVGTGSIHFTALIPAGFGLPLLLCGIIAAKAPALRMHVMHVAALVGLLGTAGGLGMSLPKLLKGAELVRPIATYLQLGMGVLCLLFVALCVKSFIAARRARKA